MSKLYIPNDYQSILTRENTEKAIKFLKDYFQDGLSAKLNLQRVTAPLFVLKGTGINDDLSGTERAVAFPIKDMSDSVAEVVHSLAKWKRTVLAEYSIPVHAGIYTDMNAIRSDEELDNTHSLYVDQWDWEKVISQEDRQLSYLESTVNDIYSVIKNTETEVYNNFYIKPSLPEHITFIQTEDLLKLYPTLSPKEREDRICQQYGAVCLIGIGGILSNGQPHDLRAPDYDDWSTETSQGYFGLNCDILLWNEVLGKSFEISSMGIRVNKEAMLHQLALTNTEKRKELKFHKQLLNGELPLSIGGGIGQSRLCMFFLKKAHIGETQASIWPKEMVEECSAHGIKLMQ